MNRRSCRICNHASSSVTRFDGNETDVSALVHTDTEMHREAKNQELEQSIPAFSWLRGNLCSARRLSTIRANISLLLWPALQHFCRTEWRSQFPSCSANPLWLLISIFNTNSPFCTAEEALRKEVVKTDCLVPICNTTHGCAGGCRKKELTEVPNMYSIVNH